MRVVFMGTPQIAATILKEVSAHHDVVGVFTQPDAVRGRGKKLVASEVKEQAQRLDIPVFQPTSFKSDEAFEQLQSLRPDIICVAAYGMILPERVIDCAPMGCLNVHTSLLPRWRGAAPVERAILAGDTHTGVCIMKMDVGLDTGDFTHRVSLEIGDNSAEELLDELADLGGKELCKTIDEIEQGSVVWTVQDETLVTYAEKIGKHELDLCLTDTQIEALRKIRVSNDSHTSCIEIDGRQIRIIDANIVGPEIDIPLVDSLKAGETTFTHKRVFIGMEDGCLELIQVRPQGKKTMDARAFAAGVQGFKNNKLAWKEL